MPAPLAEKLADLDAAVEQAKAKSSKARRRQRQDFHIPAREVTADLTAHRDAILHGRPDATPANEQTERERELTRRLCEAMQERGLVFHATGNGGGVLIIDPTIDADVEAADAALVAARQERDRFRGENAEDLEAERKAEQAAAFKRAADAGDLDSIREMVGAG